MRGSTYKVCRACPDRRQWSKGDRRCPACGSREFSWYYTAELGKDPITGQRRQQRRGGFASQEEDARALEAARRSTRKMGPAATVRRTLSDYLDEWMAARKTSVGPSRWHNDASYIDRLIRPRIGNTPLHDIRAPHLNALYADIRDNGRARGTGSRWQGGRSPVRADQKIEQLHERMTAGRDWEDNDLVFAHPTGGPSGVSPGRW